MYILKESIRYNNISFKLGEKADFTEEDLKIVAPYVELVEGETSKKETEIVVEEKNTEEKNIEEKTITKRKRK